MTYLNKRSTLKQARFKYGTFKRFTSYIESLPREWHQNNHINHLRASVIRELRLSLILMLFSVSTEDGGQPNVPQPDGFAQN